MRKIREQGLSIPLPDSIITCNGGDEYYRRKDTDNYFKTNFNRAFMEKDVNHEKREWVKKVSNGWDGDVIRQDIKKTISNIAILPDFTDLIKTIAKNYVPEGKTSEKYKIAGKFLEEILNSNINEEQIRHYLEGVAKPIYDSKITQKEKDDYKWGIREFAYKLNQKKQEVQRFHILESPTNQCTWNYGDGISLQSRLEQMNPIPKYYASLRQDGNLGFHIALSKESQGSSNADLASVGHVSDKIADSLHHKGIAFTIKAVEEDGESMTVKGEKAPSIRILPLMDLDKYHDVQRKVKKITENNLNDLVIVSGDGKNDLKMLNLFNYIDGSDITVINNFEMPEIIEKLKKIPAIAIFVDNGNYRKAKGKTPVLDPLGIKDHEMFFNFDGNVRFIHVDPGNPQKPQNLLEATLVAIKEYSKRNPEFRNNLPKELKEKIDNLNYDYPTDPVNAQKTITKWIERDKKDKENKQNKQKDIPDKTDVKPNNNWNPTNESTQEFASTKKEEPAKKLKTNTIEELSTDNKFTKTVKKFFKNFKKKRMIIASTLILAAGATITIALLKNKQKIDSNNYKERFNLFLQRAKTCSV